MLFKPLISDRIGRINQVMLPDQNAIYCLLGLMIESTGQILWLMSQMHDVTMLLFLNTE